MRFLIPCAFLLACGGLRSSVDAGSGGGSQSGTGGDGATGGGTATGGSGATGGSTGAGGSATGGSGATGGGAATWHQGALSIPGGAGTFSQIVGISGRTGEIYAVTSGSQIFRSTGAGFTEIVGTAFSSGAGVYVASDGSVFPVSQRQLGICRSGCDTAAGYSFTPTGSNNDVYGVCGDAPDNVYAIIDDVNSVAILWHYDGSAWQSLVSNLGIQYPRACTLMADHTVVIAGEKDIAFYANGVTTQEQAATVPPLTLNEAESLQWYGVGVVGATVFAVGESRHISQRASEDNWTLTTFMGATDTLYVVGGVSATEIWAGGNPDLGVSFHKYNGSTWSDAPNLPTVENIRSMFVAGPDEIYFGGSDVSDDPAIDKMYR